MGTIELGGLLVELVALVALAVLTLAAAGLRVLMRKWGVERTAGVDALLNDAIWWGVGYARARALERGLDTMAIGTRHQMLADAVNYVIGRNKAALAELHVTPEALQEMILARLGWETGAVVHGPADAG